MRCARLVPLAALLSIVGCADEPATSRSGLVSLTHADQGGVVSHVLFGQFAEGDLESLRDGRAFGCTLEDTRGACVLVSCAGAMGVPSHDAGELSASIEGVTVAAAPEAGPSGYSVVAPGEVFAPGDTVTIRVAGGEDVPAFSAEVVAPGPIDVEVPATIPRSAPLTLTWSATSAESVQIGMVGASAAIRCIVPAADRTVTIDAAWLAASGIGSNALLSVSAFDHTEVVVGDYTVDVAVAQGTTANVILE